MNYKLASITAMGHATRLWMCDAKRGARSVLLADYDGTVKALLGEGWEPFGLGANGVVWFRKVDDSLEQTSIRSDANFTEPLRMPLAETI